jgi:hypothetical protein
MEISSGPVDLDIVRKSLFGCLHEFKKSKDIQCRSYQILQDIHIHSTEGINDENISTILITIKDWSSYADVIAGCFQFLAMIYEKENNISQLLSSDILQAVSNALNSHCHSKRIQLPGIKIFSQILQQSVTGSSVIDEKMFLNIVVHIISNLRFQNDDVGIVIACCSTLRVIIRYIFN